MSFSLVLVAMKWRNGWVQAVECLFLGDGTIDQRLHALR